MRFTDIILKKRNGEVLTDEEINYAVSGFVSGETTDYQFAALLMAIYFKGLNKKETRALTKSMIASGDVIDLSGIKGVKVDKHSTGGVGDKTSLVVAPLVAAAGVKVPKLSGRGLGHTGGTIDKLESISGFSVEMTREQFLQNVNTVGLAIGGQTKDLVPADKKIYALRDVTGTVENVSLIAGSIMSKKLASGADNIVLDVKFGDGAFMRTRKAAFDLAREMVDIGEGMGKRTIAVITDMNQPLGNAIGNAIEVKEAIETLKGHGPKDFHTLCIEMSANMLLIAGLFKKKKDAVAKLEECIKSGAAFEKFRAFVKAQGGDVSQVDDPSKLPGAKYEAEIRSEKDGYVSSIGAMKIGTVCVAIGAGRETKESAIDYGAGIYLKKKVGDRVKKGEVIATIFANDESKLAVAKKDILSAFQFSKSKPKARPLIYGVVSKRKR